MQQFHDWSDSFEQQREWGIGRKGWVANSIYLLLALFLGGVGAGAALLAICLKPTGNNLYFVAGYMLAVGGKGFFHLLFLGHPLRFWRAISRPQSSWISRGIIILILFSILGGIYIFWPMMTSYSDNAVVYGLLRYLCTGLIVFLLIYDGFLLNAAKGIAAWNRPLMIILFPTFSFLGGSSLIGALYGFFHKVESLNVAVLHKSEAILLVIGALSLTGYLINLYYDPFLRTSAWKLIRERLRWIFWIAVVSGSIVIPMIVALMSLRNSMAVWLMSAVGFIAIIGDYAFKYIIFSLGGYQQQYRRG